MRITEKDFEALTNTSMEWSKTDWSEMAWRFEFDAVPDQGFIFWVDNYASLLFCRQFCEERGHTFTASFDEGGEDWCFITDYAATWAVVA
jgi:hypothetical protein